MLGALIGDIAGSIYEWHNHKSKDFPFLQPQCRMTDDSIMTTAIADHVTRYYPLGFTLDEIRDAYQFDVSCAGSVPQAMEAFLEAESFEDAVRNAISIGGDSDTIACMAGSVAAAFFGIPKDIREAAQPFLEGEVKRVYQAFIQRY